MARFSTYSFTNDDLDTNYELIISHNKTTVNVLCAWIDENGVDRTVTDVFTIVNQDSIKISCGSIVTGTQTVIICYDDILSVTGRKLFELAAMSSPFDLSYRIALGKPNTPSVNVALSNFLTWLTGILPFMKGENGLSDIPTNKISTARSNLNVYSKTEVDAKVLTKLDAYAIGMGGGLGHLNTSVYTPTTSYNPATKKYVDDNVNVMAFDNILFSGSGWLKDPAITMVSHSALYIKENLIRLTLRFKVSGALSSYVTLGKLQTMRPSNEVFLPAISPGQYWCFVKVKDDGFIEVITSGPTVTSAEYQLITTLIVD